MARTKLTDILTAWGLIDSDDVAQALTAHRRWGKRIGRVLVELGLCSREDVLNALAAQAGVRAVDLPRVTADAAALKRVPAEIARAHGVLPLRIDRTGTTLAVAVAAPVSPQALDAARAASGLKVVAYVADEEALADGIERSYVGDAAARGIDFRWERDDEPIANRLVTLPLAACIFGV